MMLSPAESDRRFGYHPPRDDTTRTTHETLRARAAEFASVLDQLVPDGREKALAITSVEEAMMWGNAGIARGPSGPPPSPAPRATGHLNLNVTDPPADPDALRGVLEQVERPRRRVL